MAVNSPQQDWRDTPFEYPNFMDWFAEHVGMVFISVGMLIILVGFFFVYQEPERSFHQFISDLYANGGSELISIAITAIVIDRLAERREIKLLKERLVHEASSSSNERAKSAIDDLRHYGWLEGKSSLLQEASLVRANLHTANLGKANLQTADLIETNLNRAILNWANLRTAILIEAKLKEANLQGTNLHRAILEMADLRYADLIGANLQEANLIEANLHGAHLGVANLRAADFTEANLQEVNLIDADLQGAIMPNGETYYVSMDLEQFTDPNHPNFWRSNLPLSPAYRGDDAE